MPSGSSSRSGPAPSPNSLRNDRADALPWTHIPNTPCDDPPPAWPGTRKPSKAETHYWTLTWRRPQARMWREHGQETAVADYVRALCSAEVVDPEKRASVSTILLRQEEQLGISLPGLARNRWVLDAEPIVAKGVTDGVRRTSRIRSRLQTIDGGQT